jgi:hypothetical protein
MLDFYMLLNALIMSLLIFKIIEMLRLSDSKLISSSGTLERWSVNIPHIFSDIHNCIFFDIKYFKYNISMY